MIDNYCERIGPGFWAEPVNAITNAAFLIAAIALFVLLRRRQSRDHIAWLLAALVLAIGIGSFLFHTFATTWAAALDVIPILLFQLLYLWGYGRRVLHFTGWQSAMAVLLLATAIVGTGPFSHLANGSIAYAPAWLALAVLAVAHWRVAAVERWSLPLAAVVFSVSIALRTLDAAICAAFPLGTHFGWHLLNGGVLYLAVRGFAVGVGAARPGQPLRPQGAPKAPVRFGQ